MDPLFAFLLAIVVLAIVVSILWQVFGVGALMARMSPNQRLLWALVGLILIIALVYWFVTRSGVWPL